MELALSTDEETFRDEVQHFLNARLPARLSEKVRLGIRLTRDDMVQWHTILNEQGWLASHWPVQWGGTGWNAKQKYIFDYECALAHAPRVVAFGVNMLAPVLIKYGSEQQKQHWLPRILDSSDWWCQGYSEPGAGSDLAAVKTTAIRVGDHYVVNGQKTWTTLGHYANMIFCLVRTDNTGRPQSGISFLLVDLQSPGVEVRPILTLDGEYEVNEVFFTDVRVPVENLVGEQDKGWTYAKYLLTYERTNIAGIGLCVATLERIKRAALSVTYKGRPLLYDPQFATRLARLQIDLNNMQLTNFRIIAHAKGNAPGTESSILKIRGTQIRQELLSLLRRAMGPFAQPYLKHFLEGQEGLERYFGPEGAFSASTQYLNGRKLSIYGGSNEIQKNVIAKMTLGM